MACVSDVAEIRHVEGKLARYAYRDFGRADSTASLVLLQGFRGTLDRWDPTLPRLHVNESVCAAFAPR